MVLGMSLQTFTLIQVAISLSGIASGLVVMYGFLTSNTVRRMDSSISDNDGIEPA